MRLGQELSNWAILKICNTSFVAGVTPLHHINLRYTPPVYNAQVHGCYHLDRSCREGDLGLYAVIAVS